MGIHTVEFAMYNNTPIIPTLTSVPTQHPEIIMKWGKVHLCHFKDQIINHPFHCLHLLYPHPIQLNRSRLCKEHTLDHVLDIKIQMEIPTSGSSFLAKAFRLHVRLILVIHSVLKIKINFSHHTFLPMLFSAIMTFLVTHELSPVY